MNVMNSSRPSNPLFLILILSFAVALLCLLARMDGAYTVGKYLFAEDGKIFMLQANTLGAKAILLPYAGYINLYPRLIAWFSNFFDLKTAANILMLGWFLSFALMIFVVTRQAHERGFKPFYVLFLIAAIVLQPTNMHGFYAYNNGEVFFTLTDAQFMLGLALTVYLFSQLHRKATLLELLIIGLIALTGPFSVILAPLLIVRALIQKDIKQYFGLYFVTFSGAIIQLLTILLSGRVTKHPTDLNIWHWLQAFLPFPALGSSNLIGYGVTILFWITFLSVFFISLKRKDMLHSENFKVSLFFLAAGFLHMSAALVVSKGGLSYVAGSTRYHFLPFSLLFFSALLLSYPFKKLRWLMLFSIGLVCLVNFEPVKRPPLYYPSFVNFAQYRDVKILINPITPHYTWWGERPNRINNPYKPLVGQPLALQQFEAQGINTQMTQSTLSFTSPSATGSLTLQSPTHCPNATDIGIEINMNRKNQGRVTFRWSDSKDFKNSQSFEIFYPAGEITPQFAFPNPKTDFYVRLMPMDSANSGQIQKITVYCLP